MKRRIIPILTMLATCFVISACTIESKVSFKQNYIASEKQFVFKNVSGEDYKNLKVTLALEQISTGFDKEIIVDVGDLKDGDSYTYKLAEDDIKGINSEEISIYIKGITRNESVSSLEVIFIFIYLVLFLFGILLCVTL